MLKIVFKFLTVVALIILAVFSFGASWLAYEYAVIPTFSRVVTSVGCFIMAVLLLLLATSELNRKPELSTT